MPPTYTAGSASVNIVPDFKNAQRRIGAFFAGLDDVNVKVNPDLDKSQLARIHHQINAEHADVKVDVDHVYLRRSVARAFESLTGINETAALVKGIVTPTLFAGIVGGLSQVAAAASQSVGALALLPAGITGLGAAITPIVVGLQGLGDAFKALASGDIDKINEAMANLAPSARQFVVQMKALGPAMKDLRLDVQQELFEGLGTSVRNLAERWLPTLHDGLSGIAAELRETFQQGISAASSAQSIRDGAETFTNLTAAIDRLNPVLGYFVEIWRDLTVVGSRFLPELSEGFTRIIGNLRDFISEARASGALAEFIQRGLDTIRQLMSLIGAAGRVVLNIFKPAIDSGATLLNTLTKILNTIGDILGTVETQNHLREFFESVARAVDTLRPTFAAIADVIFNDILPAFGEFMDILAPIVNDLFTHLAELLHAISPVIPIIAEAFGEVLEAIEPLVPIFTEIVEGILPILADLVAEIAPILSHIAGVFGEVLLAAFEALEPVMPIIADAFVRILRALEPMLDPLARIVEVLLPPLADLLSVIAPVIADIFELVGPLAADIIEFLEPAFQAVAEVVRFLADVLSKAFEGWRLFFQWMSTNLPKFIGAVKDAFADAYDSTKSWVADMIDLVSGQEGLGNKFFATLEKSVQRLPGVFEKSWDTMKKNFGAFMQDLKDILELKAPEVWGLSDGAEAKHNKLTEKTKINHQEIATSWGNSWKRMQQFYEIYAKPFLTGISDFFNQYVYNPLSGLFGDTSNDFQLMFNKMKGTATVDGEEVKKLTVSKMKALHDDSTSHMHGMSDAWSRMWGTFRSVWSSVGSPLFDTITGGGKNLAKNFTTFGAGIQKAFQNVVETGRKMAVFIVDNVVNGVIHGINNAFHFFGIKTTIPDVQLPKVLYKPVQFAAGGYTGAGHKYAPAGIVHANEYVEPSESVDYYGQGVFKALHARRVPKWAAEFMSGYASGGYVEMSNIIMRAFPSARITSAYRPGSPDYHGAGKAIDIAGVRPYPDPTGMAQMLQINHWIASHFQNITELIHTAAGAINLLNGVPHTYSAGIQDQHRNHVHWAQANGIFPGASAVGSAAVMPAFFADPVGYFLGQARSLVSKIPNSGSPFAQFLSAIPAFFIQQFAGSLNSAKASYVPPMAALAPGTNVSVAGKSNVEIVKALAAARGWTGAQWDALFQLVSHESSFNNLAQNPSSTAYGLFQFLNGTWAGTGYAKTSDPRIQTLAGLSYISGRYGDPINAWAFWQRNHWYDQGGWLPPGFSTVYNGTGRPEPVLTAAEHDALMRSGVATPGGNWGGGVPIVHVYIGGEEITDIVDTRVEWHSKRDYVDLRSAR